MDESLARRLKLKGTEENIQFNTVYGTGPTVRCKKADFTLLSRYSRYKFDIEDAKIIPNLQIINKCATTISQLKKWPHLSDISFPARPESIHVIVGRDVDVHDVLELRKPATGQDGPSAENLDLEDLEYLDGVLLEKLLCCLVTNARLRFM